MHTILFYTSHYYFVLLDWNAHCKTYIYFCSRNIYSQYFWTRKSCEFFLNVHGTSNRVSADRHRIGVSVDETDIELIESRRRWNAVARASRHFDLVLIKTTDVARREERLEKIGPARVCIRWTESVRRTDEGISGRGKDWHVEAGWLRTTMVRLTRLKNVAWSIKGNDRSWHMRNSSIVAGKRTTISYNVARKHWLNVRRV